MPSMARHRRAGAIALSAVLFGYAVAPVTAAEPGTAPLAAARTASIEIMESYTALRSLDERRRPVDVPKPLPTLSLPFRSVIAALLAHAGLEVRREPTAAADLQVVVDCRGTTKGQLYDAAVQSQRIRELRYTDAAIDGALRLVAGEAILETRFAGVVEPQLSIIGIVDGGDARRDPHYAPFRAAFEAEDGFLDRLGETILALWGEAPLRTALDDRDPLVRAAAARALD